MMQTLLLILSLLSIWSSSIHAIKIAIIGAGPTGLLFAANILQNASANHIQQIDIYESKDDPRLTNDHKSFALGFFARSFKEVQGIEGLTEQLHASAFSSINATQIQNGWKKTQHIQTRFARTLTTQPLVTSVMLNWIQNRKSPIKSNILFNTKCLHVDANKGSLVYQDIHGGLKKANYDLIVGSDGARSNVRNAITIQPQVSFEGSDLKNRWKFFPIDLGNKFKGRSGFFFMDNFVGGWWYMPSGKIHTATFWTPTDQPNINNPKTLQTKDQVKNFLNHVFGAENIPDIDKSAEEYLQSTSFCVCTFTLNQYHHSNGKVVLIGDAAHTMSSALGQGLVCGLQDANCLFTCLQKFNWTNLPQALEEYSNLRVPEGNAITELNFINSLRRTKRFMAWEFIRSKLFKQKTIVELLSSPDVPYTAIHKSHQGWVKKALKTFYSKRFWSA